MKRYEALAADIAASIQNGLLKPGDRLPSVRQASATRQVSPATVFEAYYLLEAQGLIQSRPRSGYYVAAKGRQLPLEPEAASTPDSQARPVEISAMVFEILRSAMSRDVVPLGSAFPSPLLFPLEKLGRVLANSATHMDPWSTVDELTPGSLQLRRQIALRYLLDGVQVSPDDIIVTNGAMEALNLCLSAVCRPGDAVVVESPCFYVCLQALERLGLHAIEVATDPREGIDLAALETALVRHRPKACWVMTNFQNPLGSAMPDDKKRALVELITRHQVPLIEDDVYNELYFGSRRPALTKSFDTEGWVLHCSSFSKTLAPGYRVGWVAPGRFVAPVAQNKLTASLATSIPVQLGLARYLERGSYARYLRQLRTTLEAQRDEYIAAIAESFPAGTRVSRPYGGYFLWVELPADVDALQLRQHATTAGISLAPGPMFSASGDFRNFLRVNFGHPLSTRALAAIRQVGRLARQR
ncbi:PLP-dependent aminotransferase family protein [Lysobacter sp. TY2-98]|uniref:aminotransferase-like domain-containing protein n=1 Tax=Lysobacter sp. TY2-98 TaxID=2290922 RepID=UPI000E20BB82|nr:PLP-dependent aminotransferase family protein [Lysobacter sp. TY2-98]AXK72135.1 PLP-dependent aminotransferase family protein [Lysobacter sp. TY2-98]